MERRERVAEADTHDHDPSENIGVYIASLAGQDGEDALTPVGEASVRRAIKRGIDVVFGILGLILAAPLIAALALTVRLKTGGPGFFTQQRVGMGGRTFPMIKIRTMVVGSEGDLPAHLDDDPALREQWETRFKLRADPRLIPGLGALLRSYSLDELPQLWNVVRGDMSLVGPRPFPEYHVARFTPEFRHLREQVRPGLTGLWQVTVRSGGDLEAQEAYDGYYLRNWSIGLDLSILARTIKPVLTGRDAH
jgi:lipopolysaccharide/colanic/teichoic acid biosynthesis glycosyltransferase